MTWLSASSITLRRVEFSLLGIYVTPIAVFSEDGCGCSLPESKFWDMVFLAYESDLWNNEGEYVSARISGAICNSAIYKGAVTGLTASPSQSHKETGQKRDPASDTNSGCVRKF
jgi:hypothetical protein